MTSHPLVGLPTAWHSGEFSSTLVTLGRATADTRHVLLAVSTQYSIKYSIKCSTLYVGMMLSIYGNKYVLMPSGLKHTLMGMDHLLTIHFCSRQADLLSELQCRACLAVFRFAIVCSAAVILVPLQILFSAG